MKYSYRVANNLGRKNLSYDEMKALVKEEVGEDFWLKSEFAFRGSVYGYIIKASTGERCGVWIADQDVNE